MSDFTKIPADSQIKQFRVLVNETIEEISQAVTELEEAGPGGGDGSGDVVGPAGATAGKIAVFVGSTGKQIGQGSKSITELDNEIGAKETPAAAQTKADAAQSAAIAAAALDATSKANAAQAAAVQRSNHTGAQAISTVTGLQTALDAKETPSGAQSKADAAQSAAATDATTKANAAQAAAVQRGNHTGEQAISTVTGLQTALDGKIPATEKAAAGGVATLDGGGKIPSGQLPDIAISDYLGNAANEAAMLALSGQKGDWTTRTDLGTTWIITGANPAVLEGWTQLSYPTAPVTSVAGKTGAVTLAKGDVGLSNVDNTSDANKPVSSATQTALDAKTTPAAALAAAQAIKLDDFAAPDDNTDLDATGSVHGLMPKAAVTKLATLHAPTWGTLTGTTPALTFTDALQNRTQTLEGNTTYSASGYAQGRIIELFLTGDTVLRTLDWPAWTWLEGEPEDLAANKKMRVKLVCTGSAAADVFATYGVEL